MDLADTVIVMEPVHIRNSMVKCRSRRPLALHRLDTRWAILEAIFSHRPSFRRLPQVTSPHLRHFPRIELSLSQREQVEASGVGMEATKAGFSVALSSIVCEEEERDVPGKCVAVHRVCDFQVQQSFIATNDSCPKQAGLLYS